MTFRRAWTGQEWQEFALKLIQLRHKPENIQLVPDKVKGDAGVECFSTDGCLYQCYAPEESSDTAKAASAMRAKGTRDLGKLVKYETVISGFLQSVKARRWILLCPFLDDKSVVESIRTKALLVKGKQLTYLHSDFEALVQSQDDFGAEVETLKLQSLGPSLQIIEPSDEDVSAMADGEISSKLKEKLTRAFPDSTPSEVRKRQGAYVRAHMVRENALEQMRTDHPVLWERSARCLSAEEKRLVALGVSSGAPNEQLTNSVSRIEQSLRADLPLFPQSTITEIAVGTISDWLIRCPLDFPEKGSA